MQKMRENVFEQELDAETREEGVRQSTVRSVSNLQENLQTQAQPESSHLDHSRRKELLFNVEIYFNKLVFFTLNAFIYFTARFSC